MAGTINREAHEAARGFRLQRLRAAHLMLQRIETSGDALFYSAVEDTEDVSVHSADQCSSEEYYEEDKNYADTSRFTLNSKQIKNTLVSFLDIFFLKWRASNKVRFGFYTTAEIGLESASKFREIYGIDPPDAPILELLRDHKFDEPRLIKCVKAVLLTEYKAQYARSTSEGYLREVTRLSDRQIVNFLEQISWYFGKPNETELYQEVIEQIRQSRYFSYQTEGKEEAICAELLDLIDQRQSFSDYTERFVYSSDVELLFLKTAADPRGDLCDPAWRVWESIPEPSDPRNLREKLEAICPNYDTPRIAALARKASVAQSEIALGHHSVKAVWCRVLLACEESITKGTFTQPIDNPSDIDSYLEVLFDCAKSDLELLEDDYSYKISNPRTLEGVVLNLIDACFISLDHLANNDE